MFYFQQNSPPHFQQDVSESTFQFPGMADTLFGAGTLCGWADTYKVRLPNMGLPMDGDMVSITH